jgi:hypothetical protein
MTQPRHNGPDSAVVAVPFVATTVSVNIISRDCILMGWAVLETTGAAAAEVDFIDGTDDNGSMLAPVTLTANQSNRETLSTWGLAVQVGLRAKIVAGSVSGVAWVVLP